MKIDHSIPTHVDNFVESLSELHDQSPSELRNVSPKTQVHFAAQGFIIKHESPENDEAIGAEVNAFLQSQSPLLVACKDDPSDGPRTILSLTGSNVEMHTQFQRHDFMEVQDVKSTAITPTTTIRQSKVEECLRPQTDDLKESKATMEAEFQLSDTKEALNYNKKRVSKEDEPEQKLEQIKKRKLSAVSQNPFMVTSAANGQMAEIQPQKLWLNASPCYSTYKDYS